VAGNPGLLTSRVRPVPRLLNLELLLKFGPDAWRAHNEQLAAFVAAQQAALAGVRRRVEELNRERKLQQHAAGAELGALEAEYLGLVHKNGEIEAACRALEAEVAAMRDALPPEQRDALERRRQQREEGGPTEDGMQD
jgi:pre-mRNA-splicing factor SPF27